MQNTQEEFLKKYAPYSRQLYEYACTLLQSKEEAEDVVQEAYLKLWKGREILATITNPKAYLMTMINHLCMDKLNEVHTCTLSQDDEENEPIEEGAEEEMQEETNPQEKLQKVLKLIEQLPETQKQILKMRTIQGMEYDAIAKQTGLQEGNIRVMLSRARHQLKELIIKNNIL